jgi:hypothetical protein
MPAEHRSPPRPRPGCGARSRPTGGSAVDHSSCWPTRAPPAPARSTRRRAGRTVPRPGPPVTRRQRARSRGEGPRLGILCLRYPPPVAHTNQDLDALQSGIATTATGGRRALRLCTINPCTTRVDIDALLTEVVAAGRALALPPARGVAAASSWDVEQNFLPDLRDAGADRVVPAAAQRRQRLRGRHDQKRAAGKDRHH